MGRRRLLALCLVGLVLFVHAPRTMTEDALIEEEEQEMNDSTEATKKIKAKNNKADEEAFRELETPEDDGEKASWCMWMKHELRWLSNSYMFLDS